MRWIALILALSLPAAASAACTWTFPTDFSATNTCADGDEVAPSAATEGMPLSVSQYGFNVGVTGITVIAAADATKTITSGTLKAYVYNSTVAAWSRLPELDLTVSESGNRYASWSAITVVVPAGRIAYVPSTVTLSAGGITIYIIGQH